MPTRPGLEYDARRFLRGVGVASPRVTFGKLRAGVLRFWRQGHGIRGHRNPNEGWVVEIHLSNPVKGGAPVDK